MSGPEQPLSKNAGRPRCILILALVGVMSILAAFGGGADESKAASASTAAAPKSAKALVPQSIRSQGKIRAGTNAEYPPWEYLDAKGRYVGLEIDLANAIAERLGLPIRYSNIAFDAVIPGLQAHRYDLGASTITDTKERERVVDFVDFYRKVNVLLVKAGNPQGIKTLADMCGKVAAAQSGTDWAHLFETQNAACKKAGKPGIDLKQFPQLTDTTLAVRSGRADATIEDYVSANAAAARNGLEVLTDKTYTPALYGFAFPKNSKLMRAWQAGLKEIIANGTYQKIFDKWKVKIGLLKSAQVNGALS